MGLSKILFLNCLQSKVLASVTFTSPSLSNLSSYTATVTGSSGQTLELFLNGASQGNMLESPAGIYSKDVTLDSLTNNLVIGSNLASLIVALELPL